MWHIYIINLVWRNEGCMGSKLQDSRTEVGKDWERKEIFSLNCDLEPWQGVSVGWMSFPCTKMPLVWSRSGYMSRLFLGKKKTSIILNSRNWIVEHILKYNLSLWSGCTHFTIVFNFYFHNFILEDVENTYQRREYESVREWKRNLLRKC